MVILRRPLQLLFAPFWNIFFHTKPDHTKLLMIEQDFQSGDHRTVLVMSHFYIATRKLDY